MIKFRYLELKRLGLFFTIWFSITTQYIFANLSNEEYVFVHVNRNVLLTGSELKYTAYITNKTNLDVSNLVYFQILDEENTVVKTWKSETNDQRVAGHIKIPDNWHNGIYTFLAFTNRTSNYTIDNIVKIPLVIHRIYENNSDSISLNKHFFVYDSVHKTIENNSLIEINIENESELTLNLRASSEIKSSNLSISVSETSSIASYRNQLFSQYSINKNISSELPIERNCSILSGKVLSADSAPIANKLLYLSYIDSTVHFKHFTSTANGEFCFILDSSFYNKKLILQIANCKSKAIWQIDKKIVKHINSKQKNTVHKTLKHELYIGNLQKRELVHRIYHSSTNSTSNFEFEYIPNFFGEPTYIVKPSDYIELTNFQDICDNILPSLRLKPDKHGSRIGMVIGQDIIYEHVLVCVNGIPCINMNYIEKLNSSDIKQIEIYNKILMHGELTFNGIVAIYTHNIEFNNKMLSVAYTEINNFVQPNNESTTKFTRREPNILPDIYWNSVINLKQGENKTIAIKRPKIGSHYTITINGLIDKKMPFSYSKHIEFKK